MKVNFFNKKLLEKTFSFLLLEGSILGIISIFFNDFILKYNIWFMAGYVLILIIYHIIMYLYANYLKNISLKIKTSTFEIKTGNIFEQDKLKVINFNEYFDTVVDNRIIAENSLNGKFIKEKVADVNDLDEIIKQSLANTNSFINNDRKNGKKEKYELGTVVEYNQDYLLTALTKFDDDNRANLELKDYLIFLMNFWNNLDKIYANRSVAITLFGSSSITRFNDANDITDQDLVEIIIWTFKVSKIKFKYPTTISLILSEDLINRINLYEIKERYKDGI